MPEYLAPGVYVTEVASDAKSIEGVSTSTADLVGSDLMAALRQLVTSLPPDWTQRNEHDPGVALLELLAWAAESLVTRIGGVPACGVLHASRLATAALALVPSGEQQGGSVLKRVRFFAGRLLDADDFRSEMGYRRVHHAGIVRGLDVSVNDDGGGPAIVVTPGYALDDEGRVMVLESQAALPLPASPGDAVVVAHRRCELPRLNMLEAAAECEVRVVDKPECDDSPLARVERTSSGWRVAEWVAA